MTRILSSVVVAMLLFARIAAAETLTFRFIGNEAFEITDGRTTLLSDFPYRSGASGYMRYDESEIRPREGSICLITHAHADHFSPGRAGRIGCAIVAPREITREIAGVKIVPLDERIDLGDLTIEPIATPHRGLEHYSYRVTWHGLTLYFVGDTESHEALATAGTIDVLFVTPWLLEGMKRNGVPLGGRATIVYHHRDGERIGNCDECTVPARGDRLEIEADHE